MKEKLLSIARALYATPTGYRLVWTGVQLGAGALAAALADDARIGALVLMVTTAVSSIAREKLAARKARRSQ